MIVELDAFPDPGVIIKAPTGVRYSNQSGGLACEHPDNNPFVPLTGASAEVKGVLVWPNSD